MVILLERCCIFARRVFFFFLILIHKKKKKAITSPSPENEEKAWAAVVPSVDILKDFYEFSLALGGLFFIFPSLMIVFPLLVILRDPPEKSLKVLLQNLCTEATMEADLAESQALTKQLALVFDFVLRFDDLKAR